MKYIKTAECYVDAYCKYKQGSRLKDDAEIIFYKFPNFFENGCFMCQQIGDTGNRDKRYKT